ncbi:MAG: hypothetical protein JRD92_11705 [Deltaproteobacteria bacterium]|nr:hypothetical protein [Deltaproteobacteria bacterium]
MERVRVFCTDREPLEVEVFRVVNVGERPELREPALDGTLHRLDDGGASYPSARSCSIPS